jgi:hypothetical protein
MRVEGAGITKAKRTTHINPHTFDGKIGCIVKAINATLSILWIKNNQKEQTNGYS